MTKRENESESDSTTPRPATLLVGPSSQLRAPSSLLSGALPPSLLQQEGAGEISASSSLSTSAVAVRPRRVWTIQDTALKRIPKGYPPLNPQCTTYVGDASPSVVAVRISECLRKRSIAVEYDDETVSIMMLSSHRIVESIPFLTYVVAVVVFDPTRLQRQH